MQKLILLLAFLTATLANAATRYVNNSDGTCGGHSPCTSTIQAAVTAAVAGDDIRIQYGTGVYDEHVVAASSGTSGSPITIESDNASNQPIIRYTGNGAIAGAIDILDKSYWTVQNLTFDGTGVFTSTSALRIGLTNTSRWTSGPELTGFQVLHNTFKNWGGTEAQEGGLSQSVQANVSTLIISGGYGPPLGAYTISGTVIDGNVFDTDRMISISLTSTKNSLVQNNEMRNTTCGLQNSGGGGTATVTDGMHIITGTQGFGTGEVYRHNTIHDFQTAAQCGLVPSGGGAYYEWDGIHTDVYPVNGTIDGNLIYNIEAANAHNGASTGLHIEAGSFGWTVKNNVIYNIGYDGILNNQQTGSGTSNLYYNNTIYSTGAGASNQTGIELRYGYATVENNILATPDLPIYVRSQAITAGGITIDYNDYSGTNVGSWNEGAITNFATWKTNCGCDSHSLNANPSFNNPAGGDFTETSSSATVDTGTTLSQVTTDFTGAKFSPRDDIGAYEYGSGAPNPPTNLAATVQ